MPKDVQRAAYIIAGCSCLALAVLLSATATFLNSWQELEGNVPAALGSVVDQYDVPDCPATDCQLRVGLWSGTACHKGGDPAESCQTFEITDPSPQLRVVRFLVISSFLLNVVALLTTPSYVCYLLEFLRHPPTDHPADQSDPDQPPEPGFVKTTKLLILVTGVSFAAMLSALFVYAAFVIGKDFSFHTLGVSFMAGVGAAVTTDLASMFFYLNMNRNFFHIDRLRNTFQRCGCGGGGGGTPVKNPPPSSINTAAHRVTTASLGQA